MDYAPECSITDGDLFRGTDVELYTMGTYSPDLAAMKAWLHAGIVSAGPANLGVGLSVCNGPFSAAQIDAYLTAISAAGARAIGMFDAGPVPPAGRDSRLVADPWLPALARWVRGEI